MKNIGNQTQEDMEWEAFREMERAWKESLKNLTPAQLLDAHPDIISSLPTILAECQEQKHAMERVVISTLARAKSEDRERTVLHLAVEVGVRIVKAAKHIQLLKHLIALSGAGGTHQQRHALRFMHARDVARQVPIESIVGRPVTKRGKNKVCRCPLHNDKTPSFTIFPENRWHCFGCNVGGDSISLAMRINQCSFKEAVRILAN